MQKWEYQVIYRVRSVAFLGQNMTEWSDDIVSTLPALGENGWELVTVIPRSSLYGEAQAGLTTEELWVFKRLKGV